MFETIELIKVAIAVAAVTGVLNTLALIEIRNQIKKPVKDRK